jgi:hypothetical protein
LCMDRLFGELAKVEYFSRFAAANGDTVTPIIIASSEADTARTMRFTTELLHHVVRDPTHGESNKQVINGWIAKWQEYSIAACDAFAPVFEQAPTKAGTYKAAMARVESKQAAYLANLGLSAPGIRT